MFDANGRTVRMTIRPIPWRGVALWGVLILFLPLAFLGVVGLANEYKSWGMSAIDCDGPAGIILAAWPALMVYGVAALIFVRRVFRHRSWGAGLAALLCLLLVAGLVNNLGNAYRESAEASYVEHCIQGTR